VKSREEIQTKALSKWLSIRRGLIVLPTGTGKSKVAIDAIKAINPKNILIVVPTTKLRDISWPAELKKWGIRRKIKIVCYVSLPKIVNEKFDLIILDEAHRITERNKEFFKNNKYKYLMGLTATNPRDKYDLIKDICPVIHQIDLDDAIKANAVSDYEINIIYINLDAKDKYIEAGNKKARFMTTEKGHYDYLTKTMNKIRFMRKDVPEFMYMQRMRFIYNLRSKTTYAKKFIEELDYNRLLVFCGSIDQANYITDKVYHSQSDDVNLKKFIQGDINILASVKALNEGMNIPNVDTAFIVQLNSKELDLVQRIGRVLRTDKDQIAKIYILVALDTQDEVWANKATAYFDQTKITKIYGG
jgi:superfamily II DNA or RNA helicase